MTASTVAALGLGVGAFLCLLIAVYPFGPYQLTLLLVRRWRSAPLRPAPLDERPELTFAILLCAYNEAPVIRAKIDNMLAMRQAAGQLDVLVYVDAASDGTAEIVRSYGDRVLLIDSSDRHGKPWGMNKLVECTDADIVLFTDANVIVDPDCIDHLREYFADPSVGCVTSHLEYTNPAESSTSKVGSAYWRLDDWTKHLETETGSAMGADGSLFAIRRHLHRPSPEHLIDDLFVSMSVLCQDYRLIRGAGVKAYEAHATSTSEEFGRKVRIACQCMGVHRALWPQIRTLSGFDRYKYVGHRLLRWVGGYFLAVSAFLSMAASLLAFGPLVTAVLIAAGVGTIGLGTILGFGPVLQINDMIVAFAGNTKGVWRAYFGQPVVTWDLAESARTDTTVAGSGEGFHR